MQENKEKCQYDGCERKVTCYVFTKPDNYEHKYCKKHEPKDPYVITKCYNKIEWYLNE